MKDRQFSGLFDAGLTALVTIGDVSATFSLFYAWRLKESEICLFRTHKMASSDFGGTRETGEPGQWPGFFLLRARLDPLSPPYAVNSCQATIPRRHSQAHDKDKRDASYARSSQASNRHTQVTQ
jgi:hypothetical protein